MNQEWRELRQIGFGYENVTSNLVQKVDFELLVFEWARVLIKRVLS